MNSTTTYHYPLRPPVGYGSEPEANSAIRRGPLRDVAAEMIGQAHGEGDGPETNGTAYRIIPCKKPDCQCTGGIILTFDAVGIDWDGGHVDTYALSIAFRDLATGQHYPMAYPQYQLAHCWLTVFFGRRLPRGYWTRMQAPGQPVAGIFFALPLDADRQARKLELSELVKFAHSGFLSWDQFERHCQPPVPEAS